MKKDKAAELKELQTRLYQEDKLRKQQEDNLTGVYKLTASLLTSIEFLDWYGDNVLELQNQADADTIKEFEQSGGTINRKRYRAILKENEDKRKAIKVKNKRLKGLMFEMVKVFDNSETLNKMMNRILDNSIEFYNDAITYESIKPLINRTHS